MVDDAIPPAMYTRIFAGLFYIDAEIQTNLVWGPAIAVHLQAAFDVFARELMAAGRPLTEALFSEITECVCVWARGRGWIATDEVYSDGRPPIDRPFAVSLQRVRGHVVGRISFWKAEALLAGIGKRPTGPKSPLELLARVRARGYTNNRIIRTIGIVPSTFYKWKRDPSSVKPNTAADILTGLRKLAADKLFE
jgi:hypothetical protein